jgi:hypothetical protein
MVCGAICNLVITSYSCAKLIVSLANDRPQSYPSRPVDLRPTVVAELSRVLREQRPTPPLRSSGVAEKVTPQLQKLAAPLHEVRPRIGFGDTRQSLAVVALLAMSETEAGDLGRVGNRRGLLRPCHESRPEPVKRDAAALDSLAHAIFTGAGAGRKVRQRHSLSRPARFFLSRTDRTQRPPVHRRSISRLSSSCAARASRACQSRWRAA